MTSLLLAIGVPHKTTEDLKPEVSNLNDALLPTIAAPRNTRRLVERKHKLWDKYMCSIYIDHVIRITREV